MAFIFPGIVPVLVAAVAAMILGFLWYSPVLFGKQWMKLMGITQDSKKKEGMVKTMGISFLTEIIMAIVLGSLLMTSMVDSLTNALVFAFMIWLGFIATTMINTVLFDKKPFNLFLINSGYQLGSLLVMAIVFSLV